MPLEMLAGESSELMIWLLRAMWMVTGLCGVFVALGVTLFLFTARAARHAGPVVPEGHQVGIAKTRLSQAA